MSDMASGPCRVLVLGLTCPENSLDYLTLRRRVIRDILEFTGNRKRTSALLVDDDLSVPWVEIDYDSEGEARRVIEEFDLREYCSEEGVRFVINVRVKDRLI